MAACMGDASFVPFVPRQLTRASDGPSQREQSPAPVNSPVVQEADVETKAEIESRSETETDAQQSLVRTPPPGVPPAEAIRRGSGCDHALEIRHQAIRLAAIACGRALRHAVLIHPAVIAAFVDDAIVAAGRPEHARIRVHSASIANVAALHHDRIGDDSLSPGDVIVESNGVTLGADTDTRAALLVSAAAET
jgi:hypothetical protein